MDFNSIKINVLITFLVAVVVFLLPWADRRICRRLRLNLEGGLSENPNADRLLRLRREEGMACRPAQCSLEERIPCRLPRTCRRQSCWRSVRQAILQSRVSRSPATWRRFHRPRFCLGRICGAPCRHNPQPLVPRRFRREA